MAATTVLLSCVTSLVLLFTVTVPVVHCAGEMKHCVGTWTSTHRSKIASYKKDPVEDVYKYRGVIEGLMGSYFKPAECDDVIRMEITMALKSSALYAETNETLLATNITDTLMNISPILENAGNRELQYHYSRALVMQQTKASPDTVNLKLEIIIKGTDEIMATQMETALNEVAELPNLGTFTLSGMKVIKCAADPPAAPIADITINWADVHLPPTEAKYTCPDGQYVLPLNKGVSTCQHSSLTWTALDDLTCTSGCGEDPPTRPLMSGWDWDNTTRTLGTLVNYACNEGYRSGDGADADTECEAGEWKPLPATYYCSEKPCLDNIPQVPAHAETNFVDTKRYAGTIVIYWCTKGYRAPENKNATVKCGLGEWAKLKGGWKCDNVLSLNLADTLKGEMDVPNDELTHEETMRKLNMATEPYYFWTVTIPSIGGLVVVMMGCLCISRTDSPIFNICNGNKSNKDGYEDYMGKFRNT